MKRTIWIVLAGALLSTPAASAPPKGPPPEAITACEGKAAGDACSFEGRRGAAEGTCQSPGDADALACVPANHRGRPER